MARNLNSSRIYLDTAVLGHILSSFFCLVMKQQKRWKKCNNMQKDPRSRGPGRTGPKDLEGPVVLAGQDLET